MAEYPDGREQLDAFSLSVGSEKRRIECYVFGRSIRIHRSILHCEDSQEVKLTYSVGITEKTSETSEDSIESRLGAKGIAAITSRMRMTLNTEVNWSRVRTTETTRLCKAPRCGRYEFRVYQSIREYEFFFFRRGRRPFRHDVWDLETQRPVTEYVEDYDYLPLELEFDETCRDRPHCAAAPRTSPDYDGMASVNLGKIRLNLPYRMSGDGLTVRSGLEELVLPDLTQAHLEAGRPIDFPLRLVPEPARFYGQISTGFVFDIDTETIPAEISFAPRVQPNPDLPDAGLNLAMIEGYPKNTGFGDYKFLK